MARFVLRTGEAILHRGLVDCSVEGTARGAKLILTDRRIVLVPDGDPKSWILGALGGLLSTLLSRTADQISHQIARDELGTIEVRGKRELWLRSKGEGYGMTHFEVKTAQAADWAARLREWAASDGSPAAVSGRDGP